MDFSNGPLRTAYTAWSHTRSLVVQVARELVEDFTNPETQQELAALLKAEKIARDEFEKLLKADESQQPVPNADGLS